MSFGLLISLACHAALLFWAFWAMRGVEQLPFEDTPAISAEIITPSEFLKLKQGSEDAKKLETKAKDETKPDDSKNDTKKPDNAPPPPPQEEAKLEEPPPPEPKKDEPPPPPPEPPKAETPPPPPEPAPGPTPDEQKLLEQKIEEERKAAEEKKKAEDEAKKKAEEAKKKKLAEEKKKRDEAKKKAEAEKKKFNEKKLAELLNSLPDDSQPKANIDKDPTKKGQQAAGTSQTATDTGQEAGTATGKDEVLSAREQDLLKGMIKSQLAQCWRLPGAGGGAEIPAVKLKWSLNPDGSLNGEPGVMSAPGDTLGNAAAEAALRAVRTCQPFKLPAESYDGWKDIEWVFDPRQML